MATVYDQLARVVGSGASAPRTILGFFGVVLLLVISGAAASIGFIVGHQELYYLVPGVLAGSVAFAALEFLAVLVVTLVDPTRLMLGQMTGPEFTQHRKMLLGDSSSGDRVETRIVDLPTRTTARADEDEATASEGRGA